MPDSEQLITLYHLTTPVNAEAIACKGYGEGDGRDVRGVWFSDRPLWRGSIVDLENLPEDVAVLGLKLSVELASEFEVAAANPAQSFREWRIPAAVANDHTYFSRNYKRPSGEPPVSDVERLRAVG